MVPSRQILRPPAFGARLAVVAVAATLTLLPASTADAGYSYAGMTTRVPVSSVSATIVYMERAEVEGGAIAAWVGVGGPGLGERGEDAWIQVGFNSYDAYKGVVLYYELQRGTFYKYKIVNGGEVVGNRHRFEVRERADRPNWWRASIDGHGVGPLFNLPGSHGNWTGDVMAEVFKSVPEACNSFVFAMRDVTTAGDKAMGAAAASGGPVPVSFERGLDLSRTTSGERLARSACPGRSSGPSDAHDHGVTTATSGGISDEADRR